MRTNSLRNFPALGLCALTLTALLLGLARPAWSSYEQMRAEVAEFHAFMRDHPKVSTELRLNPQLVNDRKYLAKHEEVRKFLRKHPAVSRRSRIIRGAYLDGTISTTAVNTPTTAPNTDGITGIRTAAMVRTIGIGVDRAHSHSVK